MLVRTKLVFIVLDFYCSSRLFRATSNSTGTALYCFPKESHFFRAQSRKKPSEAVPQTFDAGLFSSIPIRFGQSGIAELYSAKIRENPKDAEYNSAIPGKTERFDQTNRYH
uniref:Uncharacterized protein n=1 Tax=Candidatus Kentrum sp. FW TaxID=2126338 RepID=A0A450TRM2_9GAMM|nr:MAG: hypothetical protein BECKFW1821B_GA0114236_12026 [Candidatus Kentron sp. FW]